MSTYTDIKETLESPGMKHIVRALRNVHKSAWREYRQCKDVAHLSRVQTTQFVIDTLIPEVIEKLMNAHIPAPDRPAKIKTPEWWKFWEWARKIRQVER